MNEPQAPFVRAETFMGVPPATTAGAGQGAIVGLPFDCGVHPTRIGCRQGPAAIRAQSGLVRPWYPDLAPWNVLEELSVVDLGDVPVVPGDPEPAFAAIERALGPLAQAGAAPVAMGGDGAVSLPMLRAMGRAHPGLAVLHIDAHTDAYDMPGYTTSTTFTRAAEEQAIAVSGSYHVGARGTLAVPGAWEHTRALGYGLITGAELRRRGLPDVLAELHEALAGRPVHLCFDMDYIDPSAAPGVATPTWGGPDAAGALDLLHGLAGLRVVSADINTVSPPHDAAGMTASLAAHVMLVALNLIALGREG